MCFPYLARQTARRSETDFNLHLHSASVFRLKNVLFFYYEPFTFNLFLEQASALIRLWQTNVGKKLLYGTAVQFISPGYETRLRISMLNEN